MARSESDPDDGPARGRGLLYQLLPCLFQSFFRR